MEDFSPTQVIKSGQSNSSKCEIKAFFARLFRRPTNRQIEPVDTARIQYFEGFEALSDSHELLLNKASRLIDHYFKFRSAITHQLGRSSPPGELQYGNSRGPGC